MGRIQTGVDKLVALLHDKKKLTIEEAAKQLGVSRAIVQEWADFLNDEGLLEIKYSLSKTYLIDRSLSKRELDSKEKQFTNQRETFIRRVDTTIAQLEKETATFDDFKKQFSSVKDALGSDLARLQKELDQLKEYSALKQEVTADITKQHAIFQKKQDEAEASLKREYAQYQDVLHQLADQEKKLAAQKDKVHELLGSETAITTKLDQYSKLLVALKDRVTDESKALGVNQSTIEKLRSRATELKDEIEESYKKNLQPLEALRTQNEAKMRAVEQKILEKAKAIDAITQKPGAEKNAVKAQIESFLNRKQQIEDILRQIEKDKIDLLAELKELQQRGQAYSLGKTQVRLEELEAKLKTIEEHKKGLASHIGKFLKLLKSK